MLKTVSIVSAVTGALVYQGLWNASTNTPTLTSSVGTKGYYYVVSVAGTTNLDGITDWAVNDWAVFNGTVWQKVDNSETVYGTMASQNANAVIITGGTINSVTENASTYTNVTISSGNATLTNVNATLTNTANVQLRSLTGYVYANNTANATATLTIPNSGLTNSTTTLGNATLTLGSTTSTVGNLTLQNVTINNVAATFPNSFLANSTTTLGNATLTLGGTTSSVGNLTLSNVTISSGSVAINVANITSNTSSSATMSTASLPLVAAGYLYVNLNGTQVKVPYYAV